MPERTDDDVREIVHFAGPACVFGSIVRQRCQWCGALLDEKDLSRIAMPEDQRPPERRGKPIDVEDLGRWEGFVAVSGSNPRMMRSVDLVVSEDEKMPDGSPVYEVPADSCMRLFEGLDSAT